MDWKCGERYIIDGFSSSCSVPFRRKLLCMGFTSGAEFMLIRRAPLGDPWQIKIKGTNLSMRTAELNLIKARQV